MNFHKSNQFWN